MNIAYVRVVISDRLVLIGVLEVTVIQSKHRALLHPVFRYILQILYDSGKVVV